MDASPSSTTISSTMSAPIFKKKGRRGASTRVSVREGLAAEAGGGVQGGRSVADGAGAREEDEDEDEGTGVSDIMVLRQLKRSGMGIDLERLNGGEKERTKKRRVHDGAKKSRETLWDEQLARGGLVSSSLLGAQPEQEDEGHRRSSRKILSKDNFQTETGAVDVDKYMLAYIEAEMAKRQAPAPKREEVERAILDPNDELSKIAEQYRHLQKDEGEKEEGSVTLSAGMLGSVPEWDLGIEAKIRNIEQTELAKRQLEKRSNEIKAEEPLPNARFATRSGVASESEFQAQAAESPAEIEDNFRFNTSFAKQNERRGERTTASDHVIADRFRRRHAEQFVKKK